LKVIPKPQTGSNIHVGHCFFWNGFTIPSTFVVAQQLPEVSNQSDFDFSAFHYFSQRRATGFHRHATLFELNIFTKKHSSIWSNHNVKRKEMKIKLV